MSFDLYAFAVAPGETPEAVLDALLDAEESDERPAWSSEAKDRAERLATALVAQDPRLERFVFDFVEIARHLHITEVEARERFKHVELNTPEGHNPIMQITIEQGYVCLSIPYGDTSDGTEATIAEALTYMEVVTRETGWTMFDPQG